MNILLEHYVNFPYIIKRILFNAEAFRRNYYRKFGEYDKIYNSIDFNEIMSTFSSNKKNELIERLVEYIQKHVAFYRELPRASSLEELPLITKSIYIENQKKLMADGINIKHCWEGRTSGSTGMPLTYLCHREMVRLNKAYQEKFYDFIGICRGDRMARISGIKVAAFNRRKPPYWVYIDKYKQLQLSAYHILPDTLTYYINAMKNHKVVYGSGYASAWLFLAEYLSLLGEKPPMLKAIVTDSEGVTLEQQKVIEDAFQCPVYQTYGLGEVGQIAVQCSEGHYHIIPTLCYAEIVDDGNNILPYGEPGEIVLTNLVSFNTPFVRYRTGDVGILQEGKCGCGWNTQYFTLLDGRTDDYIIGNDGRKIGRLSHVIKPAIGVLESQIIQEKKGAIRLLVVPGKDFDAASMDAVLANAKNYLGDIDVKWEVVDTLEKTKRAKIRRVIRRI